MVTAAQVYQKKIIRCKEGTFIVTSETPDYYVAFNIDSQFGLHFPKSLCEDAE